MRALTAALIVAGLLVVPAVVVATAPTGAIFTTLGNGTEVNLNQFPDKPSVYLDGGPGPGAPATAAGLDDGVYVFQVTDPNGSTLLSTDLAKCRQVVASGGFFTSVVDVSNPDCEHHLEVDTDHGADGARTVQLIPFLDTPNPGGVYKAWVTKVGDFIAGCAALGFVGDPLEAVDCGDSGGNRHGFVNSDSKTDNFKVVGYAAQELDVIFFDDRNNNGYRDPKEDVIPNLTATWTDTLGVNNVRYADPNFQWGIFAHVEIPETTNGARHYLTILDQPGCKVGQISVNNVDVARDAQGRIAVDVTGNYDYLIWVACRTHGNSKK